jgi:hypothetical protein
MASTKMKPEWVSSLNALYDQDAAAAEHQRGAAGREYRRALDAHVAPLHPGETILAVLEAERRALAACDAKVRPALMAVLDTYPECPSTRRIIAEQVSALRSMAGGALRTLDTNPGLLEQWIQRITNPPDNASPNLAAAHWASIWPLLDRARGLPAVPEALAVAAQALETLRAKLLAHGVPAVELPRGSGPLPASVETPKARGAYRAKTEVNHDDF